MPAVLVRYNARRVVDLTFIETLKREWDVIEAAPWSVLSLMALSGMAVWLYFRGRIALLKEQNKHKDRVIRDLRPTTTAYRRLDNIALRQKAVDLSSRLRRFCGEVAEEEESIQRYHEKAWREDVSEGPVAPARRQTKKWEQRYNSEFKDEAVLLRNEIIARLPRRTAEDVSALSAYEGPFWSLVQLEIVATNLERLAMLLPVPQMGRIRLFLYRSFFSPPVDS